MNSIISEGVQVSVETFYQPDYSNPIQSEFMFAYRITLENHNTFPVKLHRRNWQIFVVVFLACGIVVHVGLGIYNRPHSWLSLNRSRAQAALEKKNYRILGERRSGARY